MITRRSFVKRSALAVTAASLMPKLIFANVKKRIPGLQLYSLRETIGDDVKGTIQEVADIGFKEVEPFGYSRENGFWGMDVSDFKGLLDDNGLTSPSGHYEFGAYLAPSGTDDDFKYLIDVAEGLDQKYLVVPHLSANLRSSLDDYKRIADKMNSAAMMCRDAGLKLGYHNHDFEFKDYDGKTGYEILLNNTDKDLVDFEMDVYWVVRAGVDPVSLFKENPGRFPMLHIKDMDKENHELNTEIGSGTIDYKALSKSFDEAGSKHLILEQENFAMEPYKSLRQSYGYMENNLMEG